MIKKTFIRPNKIHDDLIGEYLAGSLLHFLILCFLSKSRVAMPTEAHALRYYRKPALIRYAQARVTVLGKHTYIYNKTIHEGRQTYNSQPCLRRRADGPGLNETRSLIIITDAAQPPKADKSQNSKWYIGDK